MTEERYCPICEQWMVETVCPTDGVGTITRQALSAARDTLSEGLVLAARYRIERLIGRGGMGRVYRAEQTSIGRPVALKTLNTDFRADPRMLKRFHREARAAATLEHPNIVKIYDFGVDDQLGIPFIAMELLEGRPLNQILHQDGPRTEAQACAIMAGVTRALVEAHEKGVIHRDLKPDNIFLGVTSQGDQQIKVLDFGIASMRNKDETPSEKLTRTGVPLGTPHYMSPEQALGKPVDYRSDLYAIGCILYELLTGDTMFTSEQPLTILMSQVQEACPALPMRLVDGSRPSEAIIQLYEALVSKDVHLRPESTLAVADAFHAIGGSQTSDVSEILDTVDSDWSFGSRMEFRGSQESFSTDPTLIHASGEQHRLESNQFPGAGEIRSPETALGLPAQPEANHSKLWALAGLMVLCAAVLWGISLSEPDTQSSQHRPTQPPIAVAQPNEKPAVVDSPDASPIGTAKQTTDTPEQHSVRFTSTPPNAVVTRGDDVVGTTPFTRSFPKADFPLQVRFAHPRFIDKDREITLGMAEVAETLVRKRVKRVRKRPTAGSTGGSGRPTKKTKSKGEGEGLKMPSAW